MSLGTLTEKLDPDVIREIASYLSLNDLQQLSQTSKDAF